MRARQLKSRNERSGSGSNQMLAAVPSQALPVVMPAPAMVPSAVAIPAWPVAVIHRGRGHNDRRRHAHCWWRCVNRCRRADHWRRHDDRRGPANEHARQRDPESDANTNTGLRGRNGPE